MRQAPALQRTLSGSGDRRPGTGLVGTQFHPEVSEPDHPAGEHVLRNCFELAAR
jgi:hypothetical protein